MVTKMGLYAQRDRTRPGGENAAITLRVISQKRRTAAAWSHLYVESQKAERIESEGRRGAARGWGWGEEGMLINGATHAAGR